jgi:hypothetical protein
MSSLTVGVRAALEYKVRRALGAPPRSVEEVAERVWTISPGEVEHAARLFMPDSHLARIQANVLGQTREEILAEIGAVTLHHRPTRAFLLRDAVLFDRAFYCGMHKEALYRGMGMRRAILEGSADEYVHAVWVTSYAGSRWFGHLLRDEIALQELARNLGFMIGHERPVYSHELGWRAHLQSPRPKTVGSARVKEMVFFDDVGQHREKRQRYQILRGRLTGWPRGHDRILFLRGQAHGEERRLVNEQEVVARLVREGFHVVDPSQLEVPEIIGQCIGARLAVTVEGSHAAPLLYLAQEGASVLYLFPPARVAAHGPRLAGFFGMRGGVFVGEPVEGSQGLFRVDPEELMRAIDQLSARVAVPAPA